MRTLTRASSSDSTPVAPAVDSQIQPMLSWLRGNGAVFDKVLISNLNGADGGSGWGLLALQNCKPGDVLIHLPASVLLTYDDECDTNLLALISKVPKELWGMRLGLRLLAQRAAGQAAFWAPYVNLLPTAFQGVPTFFAGDAIQALQYPPVSAQVGKRCKFLISFAAELASIRGKPEDPFKMDVDANALGWALAAVSSRAFRTRGPTEPAAMLPLIDMCNHSFQQNCDTQPNSLGGINLVANQHIAQGTPLLLNYGALPNDFLLLDYGFVVPSNPHDYVCLRFDEGLLENARLASNMYKEPIGSLDSLEQWQADVLVALGLHGPGANLEVRVGNANLVEGRLVAAVRVLYARSAAEVRGVHLDKLRSLEFRLSLQNEVRSLSTLMGTLVVALAGFPTTIENDLEELEKLKRLPEERPDMCLSLEFRISKKKHLVAAIQNLGQRVKGLSLEVEQEHAKIEGGKKNATKDKHASSPKSKGFGR
eukprot:CAMPEP_0196590656 /NCGR_PEP_ID=MMETSP1081-20130531/67159_1 /TAXON_ID=36882 /ORGANISM="Pyramimonas amylifera, Strain CCMP720" /LENGTH=480 /DNA_ID=CAMNT_0041913811 /DNA_START=44 /DNA_END=1486 /DNA_ORIENTATION=-